RHLEVRKVGLRLLARGGLEAPFEQRRMDRADLTKIVGQSGAPTRVAERPDLAQQPCTGQFRQSHDALAQIRLERLDDAPGRRAWAPPPRGPTPLAVPAHPPSVPPPPPPRRP